VSKKSFYVPLNTKLISETSLSSSRQSLALVLTTQTGETTPKTQIETNKVNKQTNCP